MPPLNEKQLYIEKILLKRTELPSTIFFIISKTNPHRNFSSKSMFLLIFCFLCRINPKNLCTCFYLLVNIFVDIFLTQESYDCSFIKAIKNGMKQFILKTNNRVFINEFIYAVSLQLHKKIEEQNGFAYYLKLSEIHRIVSLDLLININL